MATYKVGQRVKKVGGRTKFPGNYPSVPVGTEGVITEELGFWSACNKPEPNWYYSVKFDGIHSGVGDGSYSQEPHMLAPLTPPGFDAFMERVMQPIKEPVSA